MRYKKGQVDGHHKYFKLLEEAGAHRLHFECMMKHEDFEKMTEQLDEFLESQQVLPDIKEDLDKYVASLNITITPLQEIVPEPKPYYYYTKRILYNLHSQD